MQQFGQRLRHRALELGLSDAEVARRAGLSERRYGNYVVGRREPDFQTLERICTALATTPNELLGFGSDGTSEQGSNGQHDRVMSAVKSLDPNALSLATKFVEMLVEHHRKND